MGKSIRNLAAVTRVGLDLAKKVFQVHAVDAKGEIVLARKLTRGRLVVNRDCRVDQSWPRRAEVSSAAMRRTCDKSSASTARHT